jgi:alkaline phosphatase
MNRECARLHRRLRIGVAWTFLCTILAALPAASAVRIGFVSDIHYQLMGPSESQARVFAFAKAMQSWQPDFVVQNGDLVHGLYSVEQQLADFATAESLLSLSGVPVYRVLGNHDLKPDPYLVYDALYGREGTPYYSFDQGDFHFVVLCAAYDTLGYVSDWAKGFVPPAERQWLIADLNDTDKYTVVFIHHNLENSTWMDPSVYGVYGRQEIRDILRDSGKVIAVFQGHRHITHLWVRDGIGYFALENAGFYENCIYAEVTIDPSLFEVRMKIRPDGSTLTHTFGPRKPLPFAIYWPADNLRVQWGDTMKWEAPVDLDPGDSVRYEVLFDDDPAFGSPIVIGPLAEPRWVLDTSVPEGGYWWKVVAEDNYGLRRDSRTVQWITVGSIPTGTPPALAEGSIVPYPNPFGSSVELRVYAPEPGAGLRVYDVSGRRVRTLSDRIDRIGWNVLRWDGRDDLGRPVPSGIYFVSLESPGGRRTAKLLRIR